MGRRICDHTFKELRPEPMRDDYHLAASSSSRRAWLWRRPNSMPASTMPSRSAWFA